jgi:hypothetical protein
MTTSTGRCLCGDTRFETDGPAKWAAYCHCASCRKHTGAPVSAFAGFERARVRWLAAEPAKYASSAGVLRGFCPTCGSVMTYEGERWPTEVHFHIGAFDDPEAFPPTGHSNPDERLSWLHIADPPPGA